MLKRSGVCSLNPQPPVSRVRVRLPCVVLIVLYQIIKPTVNSYVNNNESFHFMNSRGNHGFWET